MGKICKQTQIIILALGLFFLVPLVSSLACSPNSECDIKHEVRLEGGIPDSSVVCNITVRFENGTTLIDFQEMTRAGNGKFYNFTLNETQTSSIGKYNYPITCTSNDLNKTETFELFINPGGIEPSDSRTDSITRTIYFISAVGLIFFVAFLFSREGNPVFKYTFLIISFMFFLIATNFIFISLQDEVVNSTIQGFFSTFTAISFYMLWFLGFLLGTLWIVATINTIIHRNHQAKMRKFDDMDGGF